MHARPDILSTTRWTLRLLVWLNFLLGIGILTLLVLSLAAPLWLQVALGARAEAPPQLMLGLRLIMAIGLAGVPLAHLVLSRLLALVATVRDGDPFIPENARRLRVIAWALLGIELLGLAVGAVGAVVSTPTDPLDIGWSPSVDGWLAVLLLFVLARVFRLGTDMRADLEGTV
jgi:hypothetical protein